MYWFFTASKSLLELEIFFESRCFGINYTRFRAFFPVLRCFSSQFISSDSTFASMLCLMDICIALLLLSRIHTLNLFFGKEWLYFVTPKWQHSLQIFFQLESCNWRPERFFFEKRLKSFWFNRCFFGIPTSRLVVFLFHSVFFSKVLSTRATRMLVDVHHRNGNFAPPVSLSLSLLSGKHCEWNLMISSSFQGFIGICGNFVDGRNFCITKNFFLRLFSA